ncbi:type I restriction endonuclease [Thiothrix subterranea]|nr:type I restriction endonuclease [Thiothrix subterranea]
MARNFISEDDIEQALLQKLQHLHGFDVLDCHTANPYDLNDGSQRRDKRDVILAERLREACERLNPHIPASVITEVVAKLMDRRIALSPLKANQELDQFIRDGVPVTFEDAKGVKQHDFVRLIDFNTPANNRYLAVAQLWIKSLGQAPKAAYRRPDVILYVNGLPLVFIELKNSNVKLRSAFDGNLTDYLHDIPQLFHCNAFCILSNALETRVGSFTAGWEHFFHWLRVADEKEVVNRPQIEAQGTSLEYAIAGLCERSRLLDYVENFMIYHKGSTKIIAQNHQFLG